MRRRVWMVAAAVGLAACVDGGGTSGPSFAISDASHGSLATRNKFFYWLPPLVSNPNPTGTANQFASPEITVCQLNSAGTDCEKSGGQPIVVAQFSKTAGTGGEAIRVTSDRHYQVNWRTDFSDLNPDKVYRILVAVDGRDYGFADVEVGRTGSELKNVDQDLFVSLVDGRTLPIKFRIEAGAACAGREGECAEAIVNPAVQTVVTVLDGDVPLAFGDFPTGWTDGEQLVRVERIFDGGFDVGEGPLATDFPQYPLFFHYITTAAQPFNKSVRIGVCNVEDPDENPYHPHHRETTVLAMGGTPETFRTLTRAPTVDILGNCAGAERQPSEIGWLPARLNELATALFPKSLHATAVVVVDGGMGGSTDAFSPAGTVDTASLADFVIESVSHAPSNPTSGTLVTASAVISNTGGTAAASATVNLCVVQLFEGGGSGASCHQPETPTLGPGESVTMSAEFALVTGAYHVYTSVDTFEVVPESHDDNNSLLGPEFVVTGPPSIDGFMSPGEWNGATTTEFDVNLPEGGTTTATLFVQSDATNLYLAVRFQRSLPDDEHLLNFEFDNDGDGVGPEVGDDYLTFTPETGLSDAHRSTCGEVPAACVTTDRTDGFGGFSIIQGSVVYELSHPLNSGDEGGDFALTPPVTIGMLLQLHLGSADTRFPAGTFPTYRPLSITSP